LSGPYQSDSFDSPEILSFEFLRKYHFHFLIGPNLTIFAKLLEH